MTTISKDADLTTLINVFTVDPSNQSRLVELLITATDTFVRHARGFVSSSLHRSRDGTKVTMYAQWRSLDDYEAMRKDRGLFPISRKPSPSRRSSPESTTWSSHSRRPWRSRRAGHGAKALIR